MISLSAMLRDVDVTDPKTLLFFKALASAVDRLDVNLRFDEKEARALIPDRPGYGEIKRSPVLNLLPDILIVKALRFQQDQHDLLLESAESMGCRLGSTVDIATATGVTRTVPFDKEYWDIDDMHDNVTNNTRITFNHQGRYVVGGNVDFEINAAGFRILAIVKNGVTTLAIDHRPPIAGQLVMCHVSTCDYFNRGDYIELFVTQNSGAALAIFHADEYLPHFWAHRVS